MAEKTAADEASEGVERGKIPSFSEVVVIDEHIKHLLFNTDEAVDYQKECEYLKANPQSIVTFNASPQVLAAKVDLALGQFKNAEYFIAEARKKENNANGITVTGIAAVLVSIGMNSSISKNKLNNMTKIFPLATVAAGVLMAGIGTYKAYVPAKEINKLEQSKTEWVHYLQRAKDQMDGLNMFVAKFATASAAVGLAKVNCADFKEMAPSKKL